MNHQKTVQNRIMLLKTIPYALYFFVLFCSTVLTDLSSYDLRKYTRVTMIDKFLSGVIPIKRLIDEMVYLY